MSEITRSNVESGIREAVLAELKWDPAVGEAGIGVIAEGAVVTLTGTVGSWAERVLAERAAQRVRGVRGVANVLEVRPPRAGVRPDGEIARAAWDAVHAHAFVPSNAVRIAVEHGRVTLRGTLEWHYQKAAAEQAVRDLAGVTQVMNDIALCPRRPCVGAAEAIAAALARQARLDAARIRVDVSGDRVFLRGAVASVADKCAAERVAWSAPGIAHVVNELEVEAEEETRRALPDLVCLP